MTQPSHEIEKLKHECMIAAEVARQWEIQAELYRAEAERWQRLALIAYDAATG